MILKSEHIFLFCNVKSHHEVEREVHDKIKHFNYAGREHTAYALGIFKHVVWGHVCWNASPKFDHWK